MKRKIVALLSAVAMMVPMVVANVANAEVLETGASIVYNATKSTPTVACYDVYIKGYDNVSVTGFQVNYKTGSNLDMTKAEHELNAKITSPDVTSKYNTMNKTLVVSYANTSLVPIKWDEAEPIVTWKVPVTTTLTAADTDSKVVTATVNIDGTKNNINKVNNPALPISEVADSTATSVKIYTDKPEATYWTVETTLNSELEPYWYATVAGDAKKVKANIPTITAPAKMGLVVEGDNLVVENVKVVQEVKAN